jgi:GDP-mannose 6-dehydrogenase
MELTVFGLGYVGVVTAACLAQDGHQVIGVDVAQSKVDMINRGQTPIIEEEIDKLVLQVVQSGRLAATTNAQRAVAASDMAIVCVGTPSQPSNGALDTHYVAAVAAEIGDLLRERTRPFLFVLRSTVIPGTTRSLVISTLEEHSGRPVGEGYDVVFHPEFLREGTSVKDFYDPPKIVVGERLPGGGEMVFDLYPAVNAPRFAVPIEIAEMVKYADNAFHAVKITFANEMGQLSQSLGMDSRAVMDVFCADTKLNISPKYLRPGFAFGGSCLPKDVRALLHTARSNDLALPMLENLLSSNKAQIERVLRMVLNSGTRRVGLVGLAFKPGTDDLRESPLVELAERLVGKGIGLQIWDTHVRVARLMGSNKAFLEERLPHLAQLLVDNLSALDECDLIILGHPLDLELVRAWMEQDKQIVDLVGVAQTMPHPLYQGVVW